MSDLWDIPDLLESEPEAGLPAADPVLSDQWLAENDPEFKYVTDHVPQTLLAHFPDEFSVAEVFDYLASREPRLKAKRHGSATPQPKLTKDIAEKLRELAELERAMSILRWAGVLQRRVPRPRIPRGEAQVFGAMPAVDPFEVVSEKEERAQAREYLRARTPITDLSQDAAGLIVLPRRLASYVRLVELDWALEIVQKHLPKLGRPRVYHPDRPALAVERKRAERARKHETPANTDVTKVDPNHPVVEESMFQTIPERVSELELRQAQLEETFRAYLEDAAASARALAARVPEDARVRGAVDALLDDLT